MVTTFAALLPAFLLLLFAAWCGTFPGAASGAGAAVGHLVLLACLAATGGQWPDPLRLGRSGRWLVAAWAATVAASWLASPVPRAGRVGLLLLPAFVCLPALVHRCWATEDRLRLGIRATSAVVGVVALWSLLAWRLVPTPGASLPLGHHNLLAAWLVTLLPLAVLPWRDGGGGRLLAAAGGLAAAAAVVATWSLSGWAALAAIAGGACLGHRRWLAVRLRWLAVGLLAVPAVVLGVILAAPRILRIVAGGDLSALARWGYLEAGWRGWSERPILGWGPGATKWMIGEHLVPRPGVHPPDQVVTDLHSLPLRIGYELGLAGLVLTAGVGVVFLWRRWEAKGTPALVRAGCLGLVGFAVTALAGRTLAAPAVPLAAAVVLGALLAAERPRAATGGRLVPPVAALLLALVIVPIDVAHLAYDQAVGAATAGQRIRRLERAVRLDPAFPLYRLRLALARREVGGASAELAGQLHAAARDGVGLAPLWLAAGRAGQESGEGWSETALLRACRLNPLGALAPFRLATGAPADPRAGQWTARALLAEPLLLAAVEWQDREPLLRAAMRELDTAGGVEVSWRRELEARVGGRTATAGATQRLVLLMDGEPATALSLHAFGRRPWPTRLGEVVLSADFVTAAADLVPATDLQSTAPELFDRRHCGLERVGPSGR